MRLPRPIAAGKRRVKEIALVVEWLPEEWPDGVPSVKQLLVVALLLIPMLLLFTAELTIFSWKELAASVSLQRSVLPSPPNSEFGLWT